MKEKWYSVEQVAQMLGLHPKTLRRYITEGKLRANKLGKQYRISGHDLSIFLEGSDISPTEFDQRETPAPAVDVSAVADITVRGKDEADRIERTLIAATNCKDPSYGQSSVNIQRSAEQNKVRVMLWGSPRFIAAMLESISVLAQSEE